MSTEPEVDNNENANVIGACSGFLVDVASAGLRYTTSTKKEELSEDVADFLAKLESVRGASGLESLESVYDPQKINGRPGGPGEMMRLRNLVLDDMTRSVNQTMSKEEKKLEKIEKHQPKNDLLTRFALLDTRKGSIAIVVSLLMLLLAWEFTMYAIRHDESCSTYNDQTMTCDDAKRLVWEDRNTCTDYRCAAPWAPGPGSTRCTTCNCNSFCDACEQCVCRSTASGIHFCRTFEVYPGQWRLHGRNTIFIILIIVFVLAICKFISSFIISTFLMRERNTFLEESGKLNIRIKELKRIQADLRRERHSPDGWREDEPRDKFLRRMKSMLPVQDFNRIRTEASGGIAQGNGISVDTKRVIDELAEHTANKNIKTFQKSKKQNTHRRTALPSVAPLTGQTSSRAKRSKSEKIPFWLDDTDEVAVSAYNLYQDIIKECDIPEPTRRMLYAKIVPGQPPAVMLSDLHMTDITRIVQDNGLYDDTLSCRDWITEWVQVHRNMTGIVLDGHTRRQMANLGVSQEPGDTLTNIRSVVTTIAGGEESDESEDEPPPRKDASPFEAFVFSFPYINAMFRGMAAPTKAEAASQREAIMKTINSLQSFAQEPDDEDDE